MRRRRRERLGDDFSVSPIVTECWSVMRELRRVSTSMVAAKWPSTTTYHLLLIESSNALDA
jgi:hypothetical protein